jgi:hypothetical protein
MYSNESRLWGDTNRLSESKHCFLVGHISPKQLDPLLVRNDVWHLLKEYL